MSKSLTYSLLTIFGVLLIDQVIKIYIKTHFVLGEEYAVAGNWFILHFTENPGMAFGMELGGNYGKLLLSSFRILAALFGIYYLRQIIKGKYHTGFIIAVSLILSGAIGNIIDSMFYGMIFSNSDYQLATLFPSEGGYAGFLHGKVVDMFYFPIINGTFPDWFPVWGGEDFQFFRPVFNFADAAISSGVILILISQKKFFPRKTETLPEQEKAQPTPEETPKSDSEQGIGS